MFLLDTTPVINFSSRQTVNQPLQCNSGIGASLLCVTPVHLSTTVRRHDPLQQCRQHVGIELDCGVHFAIESGTLLTVGYL